MPTILGIDAAWTANQPSGVSLVSGEHGTWSCLCVAPSYSSFMSAAAGSPVDWPRRSFAGTRPDLLGLLQAGELLAGAPVDIVAVDMPVSRLPFTGRRTADQQISHRFGARGCAAHSPTALRPGAIGREFSSAAAEAGYALATPPSCQRGARSLIEVYPHPALLTLLGRHYRIPYKVSKTGRYWKGKSVPTRVANLLIEFQAIITALSAVFGDLAIRLPVVEEVRTLAHLKRYEDAIDALVCAWVGVEYVEGRAASFGDEMAAIWCPVPSN